MSSTATQNFGSHSASQLPRLVSHEGKYNGYNADDGAIISIRNDDGNKKPGSSDGKGKLKMILQDAFANRYKLTQIKEQLKKNGRFVFSKHTPGKRLAYVAKKVDLQDLFNLRTDGSSANTANL